MGDREAWASEASCDETLLENGHGGDGRRPHHAVVWGPFLAERTSDTAITHDCAILS
jgi:hypothetical protein